MMVSTFDTLSESGTSGTGGRYWVIGVAAMRLSVVVWGAQ
jgi:hypothetical protein